MATSETGPNDAAGFLLESSASHLPRGLTCQIKDIENIWQLIKDGTPKYRNVGMYGFVPLGSELGNLGGSPGVKFIDHHLSVKIDMQKGDGKFYRNIPDAALQREIDNVSPNLVVEGVNVYLASRAGRERIAFKNTNGEFIYDPVARVITSAEELQRHLELAARLYRAYVTAYYEEEKLQLPSDTIIFDGGFLIREEAARKTDGGPRLNEEESPEGIIVSNRPDVTFEDIGGQEKAVLVCRRFAEQLRYPEIYALQGSEPPRGILLWGPPGTGKTLLAKAIANGADAHFLHIDASDIAGQGLYGQSERAVKGVFVLARKLSAGNGKQTIIFVDEGDLLLPRGGGGVGSVHEATGKTISIFAQEMDGLTSSPKITVIISTNEPQSLDSRILSRMEESEEVAIPTKEGLQQILSIHLAKFNKKADREIFGPNIDLDILSERCHRQGLSGRDVADVVSLVARHRGQKQLATIQEAIRYGRLQIPVGGDERVYINHLATRILKGDVEGIEGLMLASATTEEIGEIVDHAKTLLKSKPDRRMGFIRN